MASVVRDPGGLKRILFVGPGGIRRCVRLGKVTVKEAEVFQRGVERLLAAKVCGTAIDGETSRWLADVPERLAEKLRTSG